MRRLVVVVLELGLALALAGCGSSSTSLRLDISEAGDVPVLDSVLVQLFGAREIGSGTSVPLTGKDRSGQILVTDIDPALPHLRVLLSGFSADRTLRAQAALEITPIPGAIVEVAVQLGAGALADRDGDGVPDTIDDCPDAPDPTQGESACAPADFAMADAAPADLARSDGAPADLAAADLARPDAAPVYAVGGMLSGLAGTVVLRDNGGDDLTLTTNGAFQFATRLTSGSPYAVTVAAQPSGQLCTVTPGTGSGSVAGADVTTVAVTCASGHGITVTVAGLSGGTLILDDNGADPLTITANGPFTFATPVAEGAGYQVTVATQPSGQLCTVTNDTGVVSTTDITDVMVACRKLSVVVNEVYARPATGALGDTNGDGTRDGTGDEFVEVMNNETAPVDAGGWVLKTGSGTPAVRFTFPAGTTLPAGARAVVFGGGVPAGGFGGAQTFTTAGLSLTDAPASLTVSLETGGVVLDSYTYDASVFGSSCTTTCASQTRSPEGTGSFVAHTIASGSAGVLWSPGVAATGAIPKVNRPLSVPQPGAVNVSVLATITPQFNMFMNPIDYDNAHLKLFASPCSAIANEVTSFTSIGAGLDASSARLVPAAALGFAATYCVQIDATTGSPLDVPLGATVTMEFATRAAASAPAMTVVLSEVGGCRMSSTMGATACGDTGANDEFVELYNPTAAAIDVSGWFVQRRSAGGSATCAATLPAGTMIQPGHFYLVGGAGYNAAHYGGAPAADLVAAGSLMVGGSESLVLVSNAGTCAGSSGVVDAVSVGAITDTLASLLLPALPGALSDGASVERKACYNSTGDADVGTGMLAGGGHELQGNSEKIRASNADWIARSAPNPQNSAAAAETRSCP